jgi:cytochrome c biogenesis protein CcmG, thiol:disulfide interchange protein DsbE
MNTVLKPLTTKLFFTLALTAFTLGVNAQERTLPNTSVRTLEGKKIAFNEAIAKGKITMISFWATWCIPCKQEIKAIKTKLGEWQKETDFNYATVSIDDARAAANVKAYAKTQGWMFPVFLDQNSDLKRSLNFSNVPFTVIVDADGNIVKMHTGYEEGGENELYEFIKELAAKGNKAETIKEAVK